MVHRLLGQTGLAVAPVGFGAFKIGRNEGIKYPLTFALPDQAEANRLLNGVLDLGINYIDTAPAYGLSEERIGAAIGHRRSEFVLSTKVGETFSGGQSAYDYSARAVASSVERSLRQLRTEVLDVVFVHSNGEDLEIMLRTGAVSALRDLKESGAIRAIGFSGKTVEGSLAALAWADVVMIEYHVANFSHEEVISAAAAKGVGVLVKKGLGSGRIPPAEAIPFVLRHAGVAGMVIGSLSLEHLRDNIRLAEAATNPSSDRSSATSRRES